ncbi:hypothetical protein ThidrDRAFT_4569 [Thiorhodococcus drewsii AZ1]|uniref:Uncharacterized protein n=1 Tax=Thiorhodococcus drewsii AZ1 TaxID=765913 RepID=G2E8F5_9GAMM|nr:hypothetical protein ThidrDRAFT_4569 [Thiorhodococcus drewsii AZ1]
MTHRVRCFDCRNWRPRRPGWCEIGRRYVRGRGRAWRCCDAFVFLPLVSPPHGYCVTDAKPLRLFDGREWIEVERPRFTAPTVGASWH